MHGEIDVGALLLGPDHLGGSPPFQWPRKRRPDPVPEKWLSTQSALIQAIGGNYVKVAVEGCDKYGRVLGSVTCDGKDVGAWLVRNGYAISAYADKYKGIEHEAKLARRGLGGHATVHDPRAWRHRGANKTDA